MAVLFYERLHPLIIRSDKNELFFFWTQAGSDLSYEGDSLDTSDDSVPKAWNFGTCLLPARKMSCDKGLNFFQKQIRVFSGKYLDLVCQTQVESSYRAQSM